MIRLYPLFLDNRVNRLSHNGINGIPYDETSIDVLGRVILYTNFNILVILTVAGDAPRIIHTGILIRSDFHSIGSVEFHNEILQTTGITSSHAQQITVAFAAGAHRHIET